MCGFFPQTIIPPKIVKGKTTEGNFILFTTMKDSQRILVWIPPTTRFSYFSVCRERIQTPFLTYSCSIPLRQPTNCSNLLTQLLSFLIIAGIKYDKQEQVDAFFIETGVLCSYLNNCQRVKKYIVVFKNIKNSIW